MKRRFIGLGLFGVFTSAFILNACSNVSRDDGVEGINKENLYEIVSYEKVEEAKITTLKRKEDGCLFMFATSRYSADGGGIIQLFKEKDGVSVPDCRK